MSPAIRIALVGFTRFERAHIEACLREGGEYQIAEALPGCGLVVCNADDETAAAQVQQQGRLAGCVMLGTQPRPGAAIQLSRPVSPQRLLHALKVLASAAPAMSSEVQRVHDELARLTGEAPPAFADTAVSDPTAPMSLPSPLTPRRRARPDHILVIDSDDGVLRFVAEQVQRFGFEVHLARDAAEALARVKRRHFEVVLLALACAGADWAATCKAVRRTPRAGRVAPPSVVLMLEPGAEPDWLHAEIAGVEGWLHKPLQADELLGVVGQRELLMRPELQTTHAASLFG